METASNAWPAMAFFTATTMRAGVSLGPAGTVTGAVPPPPLPLRWVPPTSMTRTFIVLLRSVPASDFLRELVGFLRPPRPGLVLVHRARSMDDGVDDGPRRLDHVLPGEER